MALFLSAQLIWWTISHLKLVDERYNDHLQFAHSRQVELSSSFATDFSSARDLLLLDAENLDSSARDSLRVSLRNNRLVAGVTVTRHSGDTLFNYGSPAGDAGVRIVKESATIAIRLTYSEVRLQAESSNPPLTFQPPPSDSVFFSELTADNFFFDTNHLAELKEDRAMTFSMLIWEGGFFLCLTFFGLFLIYRALAKSERARRSQDNFLMAVTHELRTPLASLRLALQGLWRGKFTPEQSAQARRMVEIDIDRLNALIEDLLEAGDSSHSSYTVPAEVDLGKFVCEYFSERQDDLKVRGLTVNIDFDTISSAAVIVRIPRSELTRAIDVAISNAIKFSEEEPQVDVALTFNYGRVQLKFTDHGDGLPKEELERVFERFYRVGKELTRSRPGAGLGLYLARRMLGRYGVLMKLTSEGQGQGATVIFDFPRRGKPTNSETRP